MRALGLGCAGPIGGTYFMTFLQQLRRLARRHKERRRAALVAAGALQHLDSLARQNHLQRWREQHLAANPLLVHGRKYYSQNDEDGIIEVLWRRMQPEGVGSFLELGVGDGTENNSLNLLARGWRGGWLGGEALRLRNTGARLSFKRCWIDRDNVVAHSREVLQAQGISVPDLISTDLDGNDWHLCQALLQARLYPRIWVLEYNARFAPDTRWVMPYDAKHQWDGGDWFGASLGAFHDLLASHGYQLVACNLTGANAFFVRRDMANFFSEVRSRWQDLYMPAAYHAWPWFGHRRDVRTLELLLGVEPATT